MSYMSTKNITHWVIFSQWEHKKQPVTLCCHGLFFFFSYYSETLAYMISLTCSKPAGNMSLSVQPP